MNTLVNYHESHISVISFILTANTVLITQIIQVNKIFLLQIIKFIILLILLRVKFSESLNNFNECKRIFFILIFSVCLETTNNIC